MHEISHDAVENSALLLWYMNKTCHCYYYSYII